jgi:hypothetical protein
MFLHILFWFCVGFFCLEIAFDRPIKKVIDWFKN